jgi:alkyl hydroperoxide reductase subunit AhpC
MSRAYDALFDDAAMANDPQKIPLYLRSKRAWFVVDKEGMIRYTRINEPRDIQPPTDEILEVLRKLQ